MAIDESESNLIGVTPRPYDTRETPQVIPAESFGQWPYRGLILNDLWIAQINGLADRLLWRDAWQGTDQEKQDAADYSLMLVDEIQRGSDCLLPLPYSWPSDSFVSPESFLTFSWGYYYAFGDEIRETLVGTGQYGIWVHLTVPSLVYRVEVDSVWGVVSPGTYSRWRVYIDGVTYQLDDLPFNGSQTLVWQASGSNVMAQVRYSTDLFFGQRLDVANPSNPYSITWNAIRLYGYFQP